MEKDEFISVLKMKLSYAAMNLDRYADPEHCEFYYWLGKVTVYEYVIKLAEDLDS